MIGDAGRAFIMMKAHTRMWALVAQVLARRLGEKLELD